MKSILIVRDEPSGPIGSDGIGVPKLSRAMFEKSSAPAETLNGSPAVPARSDAMTSLPELRLMMALQTGASPTAEKTQIGRAHV
jgi:hypothetical protein